MKTLNIYKLHEGKRVLEYSEEFLNIWFDGDLVRFYEQEAFHDVSKAYKILPGQMVEIATK